MSHCRHRGPISPISNVKNANQANWRHSSWQPGSTWMEPSASHHSKVIKLITCFTIPSELCEFVIWIIWKETLSCIGFWSDLVWETYLTTGGKIVCVFVFLSFCMSLCWSLSSPENIWFVWSKRSSNGEKEGCHACGKQKSEDSGNSDEFVIKIQ